MLLRSFWGEHWYGSATTLLFGFKLEYFSCKRTTENISWVLLSVVVLLSIKNPQHLGISGEVFVRTSFHFNFFILRFCSHYQLFLTVWCIAIREKKHSMLRENQVSKKNYELRVLVQNVSFLKQLNKSNQIKL